MGCFDAKKGVFSIVKLHVTLEDLEFVEMFGKDFTRPRKESYDFSPHSKNRDLPLSICHTMIWNNTGKEQGKRSGENFWSSPTNRPANNSGN